MRDNVNESDVFVMFDVPFKLTQLDRLTEGRDECKVLPTKRPFASRKIRYLIRGNISPGIYSDICMAEKS